jgi:large subunit ribosomal protein L18
MAKKLLNRQRRQIKIRVNINGTKEKPRLSVYRSATHIYAQIIDDVTGTTLIAASDLKVKK